MAANRILEKLSVGGNGHANGNGLAAPVAEKAPEPAKKPAAKKAPSGGGAPQIIIPQPRIEILEVMIRGTRPLVVHNMDTKAIRQMANKWFQLPALTKEKKDPQAEFEASKYVTPEGWEGMHAGAFRAAMVGAARQCDKSLSMTNVKRLVFIEPDGFSVPLQVPLADGGCLNFEPKPLVRIIGESRMRTDMIVVDSGAPDVRFRAQYEPWSAVLRIRYNANAISAAQIVNLVSLAGVHEGVGDIRPSAKQSATADMGTWEVVEAN